MNAVCKTKQICRFFPLCVSFSAGEGVGDCSGKDGAGNAKARGKDARDGSSQKKHKKKKKHKSKKKRRNQDKDSSSESEGETNHQLR